MLFNRLKIFLILLVLIFLSVLLWQNQEPLSLKLLCADVNQSCFYQTPPLPLAIWMLVFTSAGVVTSLVWQLLNYLSTKGSNKSRSSASNRYFSEVENMPRSSQTEAKFTNTNTQPTERASVETKTTVNPPSAHNVAEGSDWEDDSNHDDWHTEEATRQKAKEKPVNKQIKDNERNPSSEAAYYYKPHPANKSKEEEVEGVYDANYRVIDPSFRQPVNEQIETRKEDDDEEEWI